MRFEGPPILFNTGNTGMILVPAWFDVRRGPS